MNLLMNSLFDVKIQEDIGEEYACNSEVCTSSDYDERVKGYWKIPFGNSIVTLTSDNGSRNETQLKNTIHFHLGRFILSNSKKKEL